jgi:energy-coupling factor transporter ATP-binding protein EcfA2
MSAIWMLPSLAMGLYLGFANGMWQLAMMSVGSSLIALLMQVRQRREKTREPMGEVSIHPRLQHLQIGRRRVTRVAWLLSPRTRKAVRARVVGLIREQESRRALRLALQASSDVPPGQRCPLFLGVQSATPLHLDLAEAPHIFVVGPTGCGKTQLLRQLIRSVTNPNASRHVEVAVIDFKGGALWVGLEHLESAWMLASDLDLADCWVRLAAEISRREQVLAFSKASRFSDCSLPALAVFVDELGEAVRSPPASSVLSSLAARGRSLGVFLVAANQGISGVPRELLLNLRTRVCLAGIDQVELVQLGGKARELTKTSDQLFAARVIKQGEPERDFVFMPEFAEY